MEKNLNIEKQINYWIVSSDNDFEAMIDLYKTKHNHWSLFLGHLVIEKLLKAVYINKTNDFPPMIHDLRRICEKAGVEIHGDVQLKLDTITRFNINARYDDYKQSFYKLCTDDFTKEWVEIIIELRIWIKEKL